MVAFNLMERLVCPVHRSRLAHQAETLRCDSGCEYPVFHGVPFLLPDEIKHTSNAMANESYEYVRKLKARAGDESVSVVNGHIDDRVQEFVAHTNSLLYKSVIGKLDRYPIPEIPMRSSAPGEVLLDIGCGWGRWCLAAAQQGFIPVGIDPSLPHLLAAQRVAKQLNLEAYFVVADSRYLPFLPNTFDAAFSFSVLQHFSHKNVELTIESLAPLMKAGGTSKLHILNWIGLRSLQVQLSRGFRDGPDEFDTRYWSIRDALRVFGARLGPSRVEVDGYFVQARYEDRDLLTATNRTMLEISHALTAAARTVPLLGKFADNVFIVSQSAK